MASKECFHFTKLDRAYGIRDNGLQVRLEENSKSDGDTKPKISYSDTKIGAIRLFANFYEVYTAYKTGSRKPREDKPGEKEMYEAILQSESFEQFRNGNFSQGKINIADFCRIFKGDIDKAIESNRVQDNTEMKSLNQIYSYKTLVL